MDEVKKVSVPARLIGNDIAMILCHGGISTSGGWSRRLLQQGAIEINGVTINDTAFNVDQSFLNEDNEMTVKVGKQKVTTVIRFEG